MPHQADAPSTESRCTSGCTSESKPEQAGTLDALAAALLNLSPTDRERLAAMLLSQQEKA